MRATLASWLALPCALAFAPAAATADSGPFFSVEALFLAPKVNSTGFEQVFYEGVDFDTIDTEGDYDDGLEAAVRFIGGYESTCGFGGRVRYFSFDNSVGYDGLWVNGAVIPVIGQSEIDVDALDIEFTQRAEFRHWDLVGSGGLRYGSVDFTQPGGFFGGIGAVVFGGATGVDFDGVGPTFSLSGQRPLGYGLSVFASARTALLFGETEVTPAFRSGGTFTIEDEFAQVWEVQMGLNVQHQIHGHTVTGSVFWEAQRWDTDSGYIGDLGLHGLGISGGLIY